MNINGISTRNIKALIPVNSLNKGTISFILIPGTCSIIRTSISIIKKQFKASNKSLQFDNFFPNCKNICFVPIPLCLILIDITIINDPTTVSNNIQKIAVKPKERGIITALIPNRRMAGMKRIK